jgi:hypothetical protein
MGLSAQGIKCTSFDVLFFAARAVQGSTEGERHAKRPRTEAAPREVPSAATATMPQQTEAAPRMLRDAGRPERVRGPSSAPLVATEGERGGRGRDREPAPAERGRAQLVTEREREQERERGREQDRRDERGGTRLPDRQPGMCVGGSGVI